MITTSQEFDELQVGEKFRTPERELRRGDLDSLLALTQQRGEPRAGSFGMLLLACAVGLLPADPDRVIALRQLCCIRHHASPRLGDSVHVEARIAGLQPLGESTGLVRTEIRAFARPGKCLLTGEVEALWRRGE